MSGIQPNNDFLPKQDKKKSNEEILREMYPEYFSLSDYQRRCLPATNYWRVMNGMSFIPVPKEDKRFYKYFDKRCFELYKEKKKKEEYLKTTEKEYKIESKPKPEIKKEPEPEKEPEVKTEKPVEVKKELKPEIKEPKKPNDNIQTTLF